MATDIGQYGFGPKMHRYAGDGGYFTATNPTAGTGVISGVVTSLADTTPLLLIRNNNGANSGVKIYLDWLKLQVTVVGIGHTAPHIAVKKDFGQNVNRYTSGGSTITPQPVGRTKGGVIPTSNALIYFGAITAAAAGDARLIESFRVKGAIEVLLDTFMFDFGAPVVQPQNGLVDNSTTISHGLFNMPPVEIDPQEWAAIHWWGASLSTGTTFAFTLGYLEK